MMKKTGKRIVAGVIAVALIFSSLPAISSRAGEQEFTEEVGFQGENPNALESYTEVDKNGNVTNAKEENGLVKNTSSSFYAVTPQIVNFNTKTSGQITDYVEENTGVKGYLYGPYAADAAYLGNTSSGKVRFMLAGVIGVVNANEVQVINKSSAKSLSYYYVSNTRLYHKVSTNVNVSNAGSTLDNGPAPSYLKTGINYYSYDGHYFYTEESFSDMINDYNKNIRTHSVNASSPFYNYFQYLPLRSQSSYTENNLNTLINNRVSSTSKMKDAGEDFVRTQNTYGTNAVLIAGIAANESAWGTSNIARTKNNLFGLNALDDSPGESANYFASVEQCIKEYGEQWLSKEYLNPQNWKHYGAFLGNKASGMNVKYASDPYWGEKAAAMAWIIDGNGGGQDAYKYTIGIKDTVYPSNTVNVRKESTTSSTALYKTKKNANCAFLVLDKNPVNKFYKIQSEPVLNSGRTEINSSSGVYNFSNMYAYLSSDYLKIVSSGKTTWSVNGINTNVSSPQLSDTSIKVSANISGNKMGLQYKFVWQKEDWKEWGVIKDFSSDDNAMWLPKSGGNYTIILNVKDSSGKVITVDIPYQIKGWSYSGVKTSIQSPSNLETEINLSADVKGDTSGLQYKFVWQKEDWKEWGVIKDFSSVNNVTWLPKQVGEYELIVDVKDREGFVATRRVSYQIVEKPWEVQDIVFSTNRAEIGDEIKITQNMKNITANNKNLQYKFVWQKDDWKEWGVIRDFSTSNTVNWIPTIYGDCEIIVNIKDNRGKSATKTTKYHVQEGNWKFSEIAVDRGAAQMVGEKINLTAKLSGNTTGLQYKFVWQKDDWKEWGVIQELSTKNTTEWIPKENGTYTIYADVKDSGGITRSYSKIFTIKSIGEITIQLQPNTNQTVGGKVNIKAFAKESNQNTKYKFVWQKEDWKEWGVIQELSTKNTVDWIPKKEGKYTICVDVKHGDASVVTKTIQFKVSNWLYNEVSVNKKQNGELEIKPLIQGNTNGFTYKYVWMKNDWKEWGVIKDFSENKTMLWQPNGTGIYKMIVDVKDATGNVKTVGKEFNIH
ncbi:glucosaminidase domain-containing protein [Faecalimonas sp.]